MILIYINFGQKDSSTILFCAFSLGVRVWIPFFPLSLPSFPLPISPLILLSMYRNAPVEVKTRRENYTVVVPSGKADVKKWDLNIPKTNYETVDHIKTEEVRYIYTFIHISITL